MSGTKRWNTNVAVYMPWRNMLGAKVVEHDINLDSVAVEALVHLGGLDEVTNVWHSLWMGTCKTDGNAAMLHANTTKVHLTHVTLWRGRRVSCKQVFAGESRFGFSELMTTGTRGKQHTNFHNKRVLEVNPHPWAKRVPDPTSGRALGLGIAIRSDFQVCSADRDAHTRHFE